MSEKTKETDIVERLEKEAASIKHQVRGQDPADWKEIGLMQEAADCITRLRADRLTGWREGIEAAAKVADSMRFSVMRLDAAFADGKDAYCRGAQDMATGIEKAIRALVPPGDKEKEET